MRRGWLVRTVTVIQTLCALALAGTTAALLVSAKSAMPFDATDLIAAGILGVIGLTAAVSCWGLWKCKRWGWWLGLVADLLGLVTFLWDPIARRVKPDTDELAFIVLFAVLVALLVLAPVRRFFLSKRAAAMGGA